MNKYAVIVATAVVASAVLAQEGKTFIVRTGKPERQSLSQAMKVTGGLYSPAEVSICAKVGGRLLSLELADGKRLDEGVVVHKGDVIGTIDSRDYKAQLAAASAGVASAKASLEDAQREFNRAETLFKDGTVTEQERDKAMAALERAKAALDQATAQEEIAKINLEETTIISPMDGVVSNRAVEPGTLLSQGMQIVTITQTDPIRFQVSLPTTVFSQIEVGKTEVSIDVDAYQGKPVQGIVTRMYPVADSVTRTVRVEVSLDNKEGLYVPGMYAVGTFAVNKRENVLAVPFDSVIRNDKERIVYVVKDGKALVRKITLGVRQDAIVEVVDGLSEDDEIVVAGHHRLTDGVSVKVDEQK